MVLEIQKQCFCPQCGVQPSFIIAQFSKKTKQRATKILERGFYWAEVCVQCGIPISHSELKK